MGAIDISPLIKYGVMAAMVVAVVVGLVLYGESRKQQEWDAAVAVQAVEAAENVIKAAEATAKLQAEYEKKLRTQAAKVRTVTKEVKVYAESQASKCVVTPEFERVFDTVSRMRSASEDGMPTPGSTPGTAVVPAGTPITDVAILSAYQGAVVELYRVYDAYDALRVWVRTSYEIAKEGAGR